MNALIDLLRVELRPTSGRASATLRIVITTVLVVIIAMTLEIPEAALAAYMVLFISKEESYTTLQSGLLLILGLTVGIALGLLLNMAFVDMPMARITTMMLAIFAGMWLVRTFLIGPLAFAISFVIMMTMTLADFIPSPELIVRAHLWLWVVIAFPIVLTMLSFVLAPQFSPPQRFRAQLLERLLSCDTALSNQIGALALKPQAAEPAYWLANHIHALSNLQRLSQKSTAIPSRWRANDSLTLLFRLILLSQQLITSSPSPRTAEQLHILREAHAQLRHLIAELQDNKPLPSSTTTAAEQTPNGDVDLLLSDLSLVLNHLSHLSAVADPLEPKPKPALWLADAFSNPEYPQFAFKVTLAAMLCYVLYNLFDWQGIHTCMITCTIIALSSNGATVHRGTLRIAGAIIGGIMGIATVVFIFPHLQSIVGLVIVVAAGTAIAAWVSLGSERIAYAGLQIGLAFFMCVLQGFGPATDFEIIRDRLFGILLGNAMMALVFSSLWPVYAQTQLYKHLQHYLKNVAQVLQQGTLGQRGIALQADLEQASDLANLQSFEAVFSPPAQRQKIAQQQHQLSTLQILSPNLALLLRAEATLKRENLPPDLIAQHQQQLARIGIFLSQFSQGSPELSLLEQGLKALKAQTDRVNNTLTTTLIQQHRRAFALLANLAENPH
ncbi:FUSC family protein [uncultured Deefgea sp.]|uniref:FUSC family protein n=1 Tax=uncultured Deefgea sp. TaxID=1304914 RepID=UPI002598D459|nr:FUSC family protein [uncultured Deefgea sp.]